MRVRARLRTRARERVEIERKEELWNVVKRSEGFGSLDWDFFFQYTMFCFWDMNLDGKKILRCWDFINSCR